MGQSGKRVHYPRMGLSRTVRDVAIASGATLLPPAVHCDAHRRISPLRTVAARLAPRESAVVYPLRHRGLLRPAAGFGQWSNSDRCGVAVCRLSSSFGIRELDQRNDRSAFRRILSSISLPLLEVQDRPQKILSGSVVVRVWAIGLFQGNGTQPRVADLCI